jgi:membrane-bound serine protease (ClpP class)
MMRWFCKCLLWALLTTSGLRAEVSTSADVPAEESAAVEAVRLEAEQVEEETPVVEVSAVADSSIEASAEGPLPVEVPLEAASAEPAVYVDKTPAERAAGLLSADGKVHVYRVPITEAISKPNLFILRRSIKQAIEMGVRVIVLDMDTPGGRLDVTLDMMEILDRFEGETLTYVNRDAISAGAYISMATDSIYFAPDGVMGAAAVVAGGGQEIDESMKAKINSYLLARMRSYTEEFPYRAEVIRAMADMDYELKIDDEVLKPAGELLSLTASEAVALYGDPARPLLADGIAETLEAALAARYGEGVAVMETFEISWSEEAAKYLDSIAPILLGLGLLLLFVEFKTPGFGMFGIGGLVLVAIVFASNYLAGLAGFEAILFFLLGLVFVVVDIFLLPGTFVFLLLGLAFIIGSLLWSLSDIWPKPDGDGPGGMTFTVEADSVWMALYEILGAFAVALLGLWVIWRFLPNTPIYGRLVHSMAGAMPDPVLVGGSETAGNSALPPVGAVGRVVAPLHPLGDVEIEGKRYQATVAIGSLERGTPIRVVGYRSFNLLVEKDDQ